ncbi:MAG TPA: c-type cytochrome [Solirubrobacteraceae bacterium]|nr:c-type cytochrome [Solirubrobacteraceae bacterium]
MGRAAKILTSGAVALAAAAGISACGSQGIGVAQTSPYYHGATLFLDHCSGCHTLSVVGAEGSATSVQNRLRTNAPNFDYRAETVQNVLFALANGGFSGQVMPEDIVVGQQARAVAEFLAHYAGRDAPKVPQLPASSQ